MDVSDRLCNCCETRPCEKGRTVCRPCYHIKYREARLAGKRRRWEERRQRLLKAYGGACVYCGETDTDVLLLDHINDDGAEHRRKVGVDQVYRDLEHQGYPPSMQIVCANDDLRKRRGRFGSNGR